MLGSRINTGDEYLLHRYHRFSNRKSGLYGIQEKDRWPGMNLQRLFGGLWLAKQIEVEITTASLPRGFSAPFPPEWNELRVQ